MEGESNKGVISLWWKRHKVHGARVRKYHSATQVGSRMYIYGGFYPKGTGILDDIIVIECAKYPRRLYRSDQ